MDSNNVTLNVSLTSCILQPSSSRQCLLDPRGTEKGVTTLATCRRDSFERASHGTARERERDFEKDTTRERDDKNSSEKESWILDLIINQEGSVGSRSELNFDNRRRQLQQNHHCLDFKERTIVVPALEKNGWMYVCYGIVCTDLENSLSNPADGHCVISGLLGEQTTRSVPLYIYIR
jgi:hypothetical protein